MKLVLFIGDLNTGLPQYKSFSTKYNVIHYTLTTKEQLISDFNTKFSSISAIYGAWLGFMPLGGFKLDILNHAPSSLRIVSICSVGYDGYDGNSMSEKDIILTNVPSFGAADPVAELVLYLTLSSFRQFNIFKKYLSPVDNHTINIRHKLEKSNYDSETGLVALSDVNGYSFGERIYSRLVNSPKNHNVTILGFGNIGKTIGKKLSDLGMNISYIKRSKLSSLELDSLGYFADYYSNLSEIFDFVDLLVIACPATPETFHLINEKFINSLKKPLRIINIGRGNILNEQHLVDGLKNGKILFAGLDVFEQEPKIHPELFGRDDVILTPHIGASTVENFDFTAIQAMKNIDLVLSGEEPENRVN